MKADNLLNKIKLGKISDEERQKLTVVQIKLLETKIRTTKFAILAIIIFVVFMILTNMLNSYKNQKLSNLNSVRIQIQISQQDFIKLENRIVEFENIKKVWDKIKNESSDRNGLNFDMARTIISDVNKSKFLPEAISVNLSPPSVSVRDDKSKVAVESSFMDISLTAPSDIAALRIFDVFDKNLPGYLKYNNFKLTKTREVSNDVLATLSKGMFPSLVTLTFQVKWQNLKDVEK